MLFLAACGGTIEDTTELIIWDRETQTENPFYGETLTIATMTPRAERLRNFARWYMVSNPGVTIEVTTYGTTWEEVEGAGRDRLGVELMAGMGPDMIDHVLLDYLLHGVQNMMVDWRPYMDADPDFIEEKWFMNIFDAAAVDGKNYVFPTQVLPRFVGFNQTLPGMYEATAGLDRITLSDAFVLHQRYGHDDMAFQAQFGGAGWGVGTFAYLTFNLHRFFNLEEGFVDFNNQEFIDLLAEAKSTLDPQRDDFQQYIARRSPVGNEVLAERYSTAFVLHNAFELFPIFENDNPFTNFVPVADDTGRVTAGINVGYLLSAGTSAEQRGLAWDFLKFMATVDDIDPEDGISVRHGQFVHTMGVHTNRGLSDYTIRVAYPTEIGRFYTGMRTGWVLAQSLPETSEIIIEHLNNWAEMPMTDIRVTPWVVEDAISEVFTRFENGMITAEQAAQDLHNMLTLVMMEMS